MYQTNEFTFGNEKRRERKKNALRLQATTTPTEKHQQKKKCINSNNHEYRENEKGTELTRRKCNSSGNKHTAMG